MNSLEVSILGAKGSVLLFTCGLVLVLTANVALPVLLPLSAEAAPQAAARGTSGPITVEGNPQLFATMCALHAAGFDKDVSAAGWHPMRARLRSQLLRQEGPASEAVRAFYREHLLADPAATLSRYVSFALVVGPPPKFNYLLRREELPPDVLAMEGFDEVLANFYREAQLDRLWAQMQPEYDREIARLHGPVAQLVLASTAYLRELLRPGSPRAFAVYVEPMVGGKTNFRIYRDRYVIVVNPGTELLLGDVRHALLHFLLDPLPARYSPAVAARKPLLDFAARAPRLPNEYKEDFPAFFTECLVRAVELRMRRLPPEKLAAAMEEAEGDGYVLVRPFARELAKFEQAEPAMRLYFPALIGGIDVAEESRRLQKVNFAAATPGPEAPTAAAKGPESGATKPAEESELERWLAEGEQQIAVQNAPAAVAAFQRVLEKYPGQPRAVYGLAVAAVLEGDVENAKELFHRLVLKAPQADTRAPVNDPLILAWAHVYLGRIHDVDGNRELAVSEYRAALAVEGAPESARLAAQRGIERGYQPASRNRDGAQQRP